MKDPLDSLPADARARLDRFATALERVPVDDLPLYAVRTHEPDHERAVDAARAVATASGLEVAVDAAREAIVHFVERAYGNAQLRVSWVGLNTAPGLGPTTDRVRVMQSIGDAVSGLVLWDGLNEADRAELLGAWANLTD